MDQIDQPSGSWSPAQRAIQFAVLACLMCMAYVLAIGEPAVEWVHSQYAGLLVYVLIPLVVTFTVLYDCNYHRELKRVARTVVILLVSSAIFIGVCAAALLIAFAAAAHLPLNRFHP